MMTGNSEYVKIPDDSGYSLEHFSVSKHYHNVLKNILIPDGLIKSRVERMAQSISSDILSQNSGGIVALCVLKGSFRFYADLMESLDKIFRNQARSIRVSVEFIKVKSYHNGQSTGSVTISGMDDLSKLTGKTVIVVEDIIDTGTTITHLLRSLNQWNPCSIMVASLLLKRTPLANGFQPDYLGFEVPDHILVGYGLDYNDYFREMNHICVINEEGIKNLKDN